MNDFLELDENDPDRFNLFGGLKHYQEVLQSAFLSIILLVILFFIWVGVILWENIIQKSMVKYIFPSITRIRP
jgi:hypothetical protein